MRDGETVKAGKRSVGWLEVKEIPLTAPVSPKIHQRVCAERELRHRATLKKTILFNEFNEF